MKIQGPTQFIAATLLICTAATCSADYPQAVLDAGPAAYWRFEQVNDTSLVNGFTSSYQGDATVTAPGGGVPFTGLPANRALSLDGAGDFLSTSLDTEFTFGTASTTLAWIKVSSLPSTEGRLLVITDKSTLANDYGLELEFLDDGLALYTDDHSATRYVPTTGTLLGQWHFIAATFDDVNDFRRLYWDGVLVTDDVLAADHNPDSVEFRIGDSLTFNGRFYEGLIDEVALYDRALTSAEVADIYAASGVHVCAGDGTLIEGVGEQNDFNATCGSDDTRWGAHGAVFAFQIQDPVTQFQLGTTAPAQISGGNTITADIEASKQNAGANLILRALMFNFTTNTYVALPGIMPLGVADAVQSFSLPNESDPNDFIEDGSNRVELLLQTIQTAGAPNVRTRLDEILFNFD